MLFNVNILVHCVHIPQCHLWICLLFLSCGGLRKVSLKSIILPPHLIRLNFFCKYCSILKIYLRYLASRFQTTSYVGHIKVIHHIWILRLFYFVKSTFSFLRQKTAMRIEQYFTGSSVLNTVYVFICLNEWLQNVWMWSVCCSVH